MLFRSIASIDKRWLPVPETISVTFHLKGGLAFAYEQKPDDIEVSLEQDPPIRRVVRQIYSIFWFLRDIAPYYAECEIISPQVVREYHKKNINKLSQLYQYLETDSVTFDSSS